MTTTIDNNQRVFQVITSTGKQFFCNLADLNKVVTENNMHSGYYTINHFWDNKPKKASKKLIKDMFAAHKIKQEFHY